jgi:hypothetical protein
MKHLLFGLTCLVLFVVVSACGGREMVAVCDEGPGWNACVWNPDDLKPGQASSLCCPPSAHWCGGVGLNCPPGYCCEQEPVPGPVTGGPVDADAGTD